MTGEELVQQFESAATSPGTFHHADHVRLAFEYLCRYPTLEALARFSAALQRFATARGETRLYHETITWGYLLLLIRERMARAGGPQTGSICRAERGLAPMERGSPFDALP